MLCTRVQRETSAKLADARAAGDDFRKGPTAEVAQLRERVAQLEAQLAAKSARAPALALSCTVPPPRRAPTP